jgi:hypothetical protein
MKVMDEPVNDEIEKQIHQKPPLSVIRIAGEIITSMVTGFTATCPVLYLIGASTPEGCFSGFAALGYMLLTGPPVYGLGSSIGVFLIGSIGKQTGSFLLTLASGFLGGLFTLVLLRVLLRLSFTESSNILIVGLLDIILPIVVCVLVIFIPPITATLGFNLTRRFKKPPLS